MRETGAKIGSGFRTLFWGPLVLAHFPQAPKTGSHFLARVLGGGVPPRPSLWSSLLEPSNLDADQKSSARCSQITYMIICGIQSYSLNCSQKEQGGSSSLHVRMYALVLAPCSNCGGPFVQGHIFYGFFRALVNGRRSTATTFTLELAFGTQIWTRIKKAVTDAVR